jgi:hypothetical protein
MGDVNSRIPALTEGYASILLDPASPLYAPDVVTWGHGIWRDVAEVDTKPGTRYAQAPAAKPMLVGVFKFNQGWQDSNAIQPYGMPSYSTGTIIRQGLVGYEFAMAEVGKSEDYMKYLMGDKSMNVASVRTLYADWMAAWKGAAAGSKLALFFEDESGFPIVAVVPNPASPTLDGGTFTAFPVAVSVVNTMSPTLAGATFAGFLEVIAKEHERVYFDVRL